MYDRFPVNKRKSVVINEVGMKKYGSTHRRAEIRRLLLIGDSLTVDELASDLEVSVATIRRDLTILENAGFIQRTHGGAMIGAPHGADQAFSVREQTDRDAKRSMARTAIGLINAERTLFLNDGSTMVAVARELAALDMNLTVATCGINVATTLSENPKIRAYLAGGIVRHRMLGITGGFVDHMLSAMNADIAFLAAESVDARDGMTFSYEEDAMIARKMNARAKKTIALATSRKLGARERFLAFDRSEIDLLITDCAIPEIIDPFREAGIDVLITTRAISNTLNLTKFLE